MLKNNLLNKGSKAVYYTVVFKVGSQFLSIAITIFLVRVLSEHDYGVYNLLYSIIGIMGIIASFGLSNTLQRYMPEYYQRGEFVLANRLYRTASFIRLSTNIIILALLLIFWDIFAGYLKIQDYRNYFLIFSFVIILYTQWGLLDVCLNSYFLHKYTQGLFFVLMLVKGLGYSVAYVYKFNLGMILLIDLLGYFVLFIALQYVYANKIPKNEGRVLRFDPDEKRRVSKYALYYNFNDVGVQLLDVNVDNFILAYYLNPVAVGAYAFCNKIAKMIDRSTPITYLIDVVRPLFFSAYSTNTSAAKAFYQFLIKVIYLFYIPIIVFVIVYNKEMIGVIFGGKYIEYSYILIAVLCFRVLTAFETPLGLVAQLHERVEIILFSKIFGLYNLIADIIMIKWWGVMGAVFATGSALLFRNIFIWWFIKEQASFKGIGSFFLKLIFYALVLLILLMLSERLLISEGQSLILGIVIMICSLLVFMRLSLFSLKEKQWLSKAADKKYNAKILRWLGLEST